MDEYTVIDRVFAWQLEIGDWILIGEYPAKITGVVKDDTSMMAFSIIDQNDDEEVVHFTTDRELEIIGWL